jgi:hypothetical protein
MIGVRGRGGPRHDFDAVRGLVGPLLLRLGERGQEGRLAYRAY